MILDCLNNPGCDYGVMLPRLGKAFAWLKTQKLNDLPVGTAIPIDGDSIYAKISSYTSKKPADARFETHRRFIDIQIIISGRETIYWYPTSQLTQVQTPYDEKKDIEFFVDPANPVPVVLEAGSYAVFFPCDGHKPNCMIDKQEEVKKMVIKVEV